MKFNNVRIEPEGLRPEAAAEFIAVSTSVLERCRRANWIRPAVDLHKLTIYRPAALRLLLNRIEREGLPPRTENETRDQCPASPEGV